MTPLHNAVRAMLARHKDAPYAQVVLADPDRLERLVALADGLYAADCSDGSVERHPTEDAAMDWVGRPETWERLQGKVIGIANGS